MAWTDSTELDAVVWISFYASAPDVTTDVQAVLSVAGKISPR